MWNVGNYSSCNGNHVLMCCLFPTSLILWKRQHRTAMFVGIHANATDLQMCKTFMRKSVSRDPRPPVFNLESVLTAFHVINALSSLPPVYFDWIPCYSRCTPCYMCILTGFRVTYAVLHVTCVFWLDSVLLTLFSLLLVYFDWIPYYSLCGPAVYFVLTHGDLQRREWTFCCSVMKRVEKYKFGRVYRWRNTC